MAMKENDLTYELICAAVNGEKTALEEILRFYDDYINALATVKGEDAQGKTVSPYDVPETEHRLQHRRNGIFPCGK